MRFSSPQRRSLLQGMAALGGAHLLGPALAQSAKTAWPTKPIRLVVPFNAGGATDIRTGRPPGRARASTPVGAEP